MEIEFADELASQLEELDNAQLAEVLAFVTNRICEIIIERCSEDEDEEEWAGDLDDTNIH